MIIAIRCLVGLKVKNKEILLANQLSVVCKTGNVCLLWKFLDKKTFVTFTWRVKEHIGENVTTKITMLVWIIQDDPSSQNFSL